ncbi:uncharacterized protein LOC114299868 isoform X4 [Camellia sinensis]|uniref:uncharacterized protein LOC114299868 isoform X4 n=1 Tax=Camellia sinensis TaxID=4442 RepID=UPI001036061D|nr:uncharacterized protein LOC114299868 isoform X4 [Camellia sinensis]
MMPQMTTPTWVEPPSVSKNTEVKVLEPASSNDAIAKPRIILQTTSEVDLLDDGESMARKLLKEILIQDSYSFPSRNIATKETRNATWLVALAIIVGLGALTHTLGTLVPVIEASGFATAAAATTIRTVVGSFR